MYTYISILKVPSTYDFFLKESTPINTYIWQIIVRLNPFDPIYTRSDPFNAIL